MGKYIKLFNNHSEYTAFTQTDAFVRPNVSHCIQENEVHYNPYDYSDRYLTFIALEDDSTFSFAQVSSNTISYSIDDGETWVELSNGASTPSINTGEKVMWKGGMTSYMDVTQNLIGVGKFSSTKTFDAEGNVMSLLYGDNFEGEKSLEGRGGGIAALFMQSNIVNAKNLCLPATTLYGACYYSMFYGCTSLTTAPKLPAMTMTSYHLQVLEYDIDQYVGSYGGMFVGCSSLTTAPQLPATTLANNCYRDMFNGCTNLTTAPELPATTLTESCYDFMFFGCTNLTTAPELPATTLAFSCYRQMFAECTSLTTAPELPATTLADNCYNSMFDGCTNLTTAPELPATTLTGSCYCQMFKDCTSLTTAPELPATTLAISCYYGMFQGCSRLNYIKAMFTTTPSNNYTINWVNGVAASGTFVKNSAATWNVTGVNGIPNGWTIETASE